MVIPSGFSPSGASATYVVLERELLKRTGGGKQCVEEGHRLFQVGRVVEPKGAEGADKAEKTIDGQTDASPIHFVCGVCCGHFRVSASGAAQTRTGSQEENKDALHNHHWHGAKNNPELPTAPDTVASKPAERRFACCEHEKGSHPELRVVAEPPIVDRTLLGMLLNGNPTQKKNVLSAICRLLEDVIGGRARELKVWADKPEGEPKEKTRWFKFVEWKDSLEGVGASVLISLGYVPRPSAESPVSFDPPAPSERLWDALAELKTQFTEELGTKEINQITLEKQETVGSGTTAVEKVTGLVPYTRRTATVNPLSVGSFSGVGWDRLQTSKPAPAYALLGVHETAPDNLVISAYEKQVKDDPHAREWYLSAFQDLATGRSSTEMNQYYNDQIARGWFNVYELFGALATLGIRNQVAGAATKRENVVNLMATEAPALTELRKTIDVQGIADYVAVAYSDEPTSKQGEIRKALKTVAMWLGSPKNKPLVDLGTQLDEWAGDFGGWQTLPHEDEAAGDTDSTLGAASESGSAKTAQEDADMPALESADGTAVEVVRIPGAPVGLVNIAQTCYLNSLLQYWFTLKVVRDEVLRRAPGAEEGEGDDARAAKFVALLGKLFHSMIWSDADSVRPERELAELALTPKYLFVANEEKKEEPVIGESESAAGAGDGGLAGVPLMEVDTLMPAASAAVPAAGEDTPMAEADEDVENRDPAAGQKSASPPPIESLSLSGVPPSELGAASGVATETAAVSGDPMDLVAAAPGGAKANVMDLVKGISSFTASADVSGPEKGVTVVEASEARVPAAPSTGYTLGGSSSLANAKSKTTMTLGQQQDLTECLDNVMDMLETALKSRKRKRDESADATDEARQPSPSESSSGSEHNAIKNLFYGVTRQHLTYKPANSNSETTTTKDEEFSHFLLNPVADIKLALDQHFETTPVDFEGSEAVKELSLLKIPAVLTIVINRVQFDPKLQRPFKDQSFMRFTDTLQLARYSDANLQNAKVIKARAAELKAELAALEAKLAETKRGTMGEQAPVADVETLLKETMEYFTTDPFDVHRSSGNELQEQVAAVVTSIAEEQGRVTNEINDLELDVGRKKLELEKLWTELDETDSTGEFGYTLHAVFMHRGEASYGHYWIYIRDPASGRWFKMNDSSVTAISESEVFKRADDTSDVTANAYCLVYVRTTDLPRIINVKARDVAIRNEYRGLEAAVDEARGRSPTPAQAPEA